MPAGPLRDPVAGRSWNSSSNARSRGSNATNERRRHLRTYLGGASYATALTTVVREIPNRLAIAASGTSAAASI